MYEDISDPLFIIHEVFEIFDDWDFDDLCWLKSSNLGPNRANLDHSKESYYIILYSEHVVR